MIRRSHRISGDGPEAIAALPREAAPAGAGVEPAIARPAAGNRSAPAQSLGPDRPGGPGGPGGPAAPAPQEPARPDWRTRAANPGIAAYLLHRPGSAASREALEGLATREEWLPGCRPAAAVDLDQEPHGLAVRYAVPTLVVYRDGEEAARAVGANAIEGFLDALFIRCEKARRARA